MRTAPHFGAKTLRKSLPCKNRTSSSWLALCAAGVLLMSLSGCVTRDRSGKAVIDRWNSRFNANTGTVQGITPWDAGGSLRDFVYEGIAVKDYEYKRYVELIRRGTSWGGFGAQAASIGLNAAVPLTGTGTGKTLSAIAGAITGTSAAFSKNVLFDQSVTVFVGRMDALRKAKLQEIEASLHGPTYTQAQAYRDIQDYGYQGTLDAALANVATNTPEQTTEPQ